MRKTLPLLLICIFIFNYSRSQSLTSLGGGMTMHGNVRVMQYDSLYNLLYIGGDFRSVDGVHANNIACWDGTTWFTMNGGINGTVRSMKLVGHDLYVGGYFQTAGGVSVSNIAKWNRTSWFSPGSGLPYIINNLELFQGVVYATGYLQNGSITSISAYNGTTWNQGFSSFDGGNINGMLATDSALLIYGNFNKLNGDTAYRLVSFNGTNFYTYPSRFYGVYSLALKDSSIYVAGNSNYITNHPTIWKNGVWQTDSTKYMDRHTEKLFTYNDTLYSVLDVGGIGSYLHIKPVTSDSIGSIFAKFKYATQYYQRIYSVVSCGQKLFLGSDLTHFNDTLSMGVFYKNGSSWATIGKNSFLNESQTYSYAFTTCMIKDSTNGDLIAGGQFFFAGEKYSPYVARWDGSSWHVMGQGLDKRVVKLIHFQNEIYAVGYFLNSGPTRLNCIAKWNGTDWVPLGTGANSFIRDACIYRNELYVGGDFDTINGIRAPYCAKFDGTNWYPVGSNALDATVSSLVVYNDTLIAGAADHFFVGTSSLSKFAHISGSLWTSTGFPNPTLYDPVTSMLVFNGELFACISGYTSSATSSKIFKFSGSTWSSIGTIGANFLTFFGQLYDFHGQLAVSSINEGLFIYDGVRFNKYSNLGTLCILNDSTNVDFVGGIIHDVYHGNTVREINSIGKLEFTFPQVALSMNEDTICERQYEFYHAVSNDIFVNLHWHFPGGMPDTLYNSWDPIIQYVNPGNYQAYLVATNLIGTDTIFFSSDLTVLPCLVGTEENLSSQLMVYPNPTSSYIKINHADKIDRIELTDLTGKILLSMKYNIDTGLDLTDFPAGVYLLKCRGNDFFPTYKIFKQ